MSDDLLFLVSWFWEAIFTWDDSFDDESVFTLSSLWSLSSQDFLSFGVVFILVCNLLSTFQWSLNDLGRLITYFSLEILEEVWILLSI